MFGAYLELGFEHILDVRGMDHVLFLIALTIIYTLKDWKRVIILATAFTVGHSLTLALSALDIVRINSTLVEILIAVTILLAAVYNFGRTEQAARSRLRYATAFGFGLIHGMGFSNFFKSILGKDDILVPLLAFNIGVELAQILIVIMTTLINYLVYRLITTRYRYWQWFVSLVIALWAIVLIVERL